MRNKHLFLLVLPLLLAACNTRTAQLTVLQPARFKVPEHIATLAVVDRSKPSNGWLNVLEGVLTGEAIGQDRRSREQAVSGLSEALGRTPRFSIKSTGIELSGSKAGVNLPAPLPWAEVEKICYDYGADAVVAIESFDSDNAASARMVQTKKKDKSGKQTIQTHYESEQRTSVRIGWRMYDPKTRTIIDEITTDDYLRNNGRGDTERAALSNLPAPVDVTRKVAYLVGQEYGARIAPVYVRVSRSYYKKAKGFETQMEKADRFARAGEWKRAAETWKLIAERATDNPKAAGRAAYNMAVAAEMEGKLDLALEWARKAWTSYGNKKARAYIQIIEQRQYDAERVDQQMNKKV